MSVRESSEAVLNRTRCSQPPHIGSRAESVGFLANAAKGRLFRILDTPPDVPSGLIRRAIVASSHIDGKDTRHIS